MKLNKIYVDHQIANVEKENIEIEDISKFVWLTIPKTTNSDARSLVTGSNWLGKMWIYHRPADFVEVDEKLYYVIQMPALYIRATDEKIPAVLFSIRGTEQFIVHVYSESEIAILEPYFSDGYFIASWEGMLVSMLEPVPEVFVDMVKQKYMKEI